MSQSFLSVSSRFSREITPSQHPFKPNSLKASLSACLIVKNEAHCLARCLESIQGLVDEIILVDTGSTDRTIEIAQQYTSKIFSLPWEDHFSQARNFGLEQASGSWILVIDADERIPPETAELIPQYLSRQEFQNQPCVLNARVGPPGQPTQFKRCLFRHHQGLIFGGRVHEKLVLPEGQVRLLDCAPLWVHHDLPDPVRQRDKLKGYDRLIQQELEGEPLPAERKAELWKHRAEALETLVGPKEALKAWQKAWFWCQQADLPEADLFPVFLLCQRLRAGFWMAESPETLEAPVQALLQRAPTRLESWFYKGYLAFIKADLFEAQSCFQQARSRQQTASRNELIRLDLMEARTRLGLGQIPSGLSQLQALYQQVPQPEIGQHLIRAWLLAGEFQQAGQLWTTLYQQSALSSRHVARNLLRTGIWSPGELRSLQRMAKGFKGA